MSFNHIDIMQSLQKTIKEENYIEYLKILQTSLENIQRVDHLNTFLVMLYQIEFEHYIYKEKDLKNAYKEFLISLKLKISHNLSQGIIPHQEYLFLYKIFKDFTFENDENITSLLEFFQDDIQKLPWDSKDKFVENDIIFLLEIFNGVKEEAFKNYIKNIVLYHIHIGQEKNYYDLVKKFSHYLDDFTLETILDIYKYYLNPDIYCSLHLEEKKSLFAWGYALFNDTPKFTKNKKTTQLYPYLKKVIDTLIQNNETEELMYAEFFTMITQVTTYDKQEQSKKFNDEITELCAKSYNKFAIQQTLPQPQEYNNPKKKIAFIFERLAEHTPFQVTFSLLKQLQQNKNFTEHYEIEIYPLNYFLPLFNEAEIVKNLEDIGIKVIFAVDTFLDLDNYSNRVQRALQIRETLINNKVDIMVACFNNYDVLNFLFATRTTPKQVYWSHGNHHYNVINIDKKITNCGIDSSNKEIQQIGTIFDPDNELNENEKQILEDTKKEYPQDSFILGTIGRLVKIDNEEYISMVEKLLTNNPQTIYIACGSGNIDSVKNKFKNKKLLERVFFPGHINAKIYGYIINLYLDTFPNEGGNSIREFTSKGNITIRKSMYEMNMYYNIDCWNEYFDYSKVNKKYFYDTFTQELSDGQIEKYSQEFVNEFFKQFKNYPLYDNFEEQYYNLANLCINDQSFNKNINKVIQAFWSATEKLEKKFNANIFLTSVCG